MKYIGAQLYTVREKLTSSDEIKATLAAIKNIGYDSVQLFGSIDLASSHAKAAKEEGLAILGVLTDLSECELKSKEWFDLCKEYNIKDIGVSSNFSECQDTKAYIKRVNMFATEANDKGFTFSYHNHNHEFIKLDSGEIPMFSFLEGFETETVNFMPDTYWLHDGGYDVRYFLEQTEGRVKILHLKDMKCTEEGHTFAELGNGNLYFEGIIKTAHGCGIKHFVVEQDVCEGDPIESLKQSYKFIKSLLEV